MIAISAVIELRRRVARGVDEMGLLGSEYIFGVFYVIVALNIDSPGLGLPV